MHINRLLSELSAQNGLSVLQWDSEVHVCNIIVSSGAIILVNIKQTHNTPMEVQGEEDV
jgi:hypothetical protein